MNANLFQKKLVGIQDNMMNFALKLTENRDDAQDLLQETTLKVLDNQDKFVDNSNFTGWVMTVMRNTFINNYHKLVRMHTLIDQSTDVYNVDVYTEASFDSPDGSFQLSEINNAIEDLNNELRAPFSFYLAGYKYHEIAEKMDLPIGTVKSRIFFARQALQKSLKDFRKS